MHILPTTKQKKKAPSLDVKNPYLELMQEHNLVEIYKEVFGVVFADHADEPIFQEKLKQELSRMHLRYRNPGVDESKPLQMEGIKYTGTMVFFDFLLERLEPKSMRLFNIIRLMREALESFANYHARIEFAKFANS